MQQFIAKAYFGDQEVIGEGDSPHEASADCLKKLHEIARRMVAIEWRLSESVSIPWDVFSGRNMPTVPPDGYRFLVMIRMSHNDGLAYDWRLFSVKADTQFSLESGFPAYARAEEEEGDEFPAASFAAGTTPVEHAFADCNAEYEYRLPPDSKEWVDGKWIACEAAQYDY